MNSTPLLQQKIEEVHHDFIIFNIYDILFMAFELGV